MNKYELLLLKSKNFYEFKNNLKNLDDKERGDAFELLVKYYLLLEPKYKSVLKSVYLFKDIPSSIKKKLELPASDNGIDLIGITHDNLYWSIQCKYREKDHTISHRELSTFGNLSFVLSSDKFSFGLVCTTTSS